ncbi:MAG: DUF6600 domain-containing protein [Candidatus Hydrogenedentes bacterium]|nr:DUF6600 domain-containing protein [Candidatus Hydrogenedentota bacterium]
MTTANGFRRGWQWFAAAIAVVFALPLLAQDLLHARISHESGGALVRGTEDADWSYATVNTIVLPSDTLWIDEEGTLEVEMTGGSFLRMADRTKAELQALPPSASINAWAGSFYVQRISRSNGDFKLRTPAATIVIDQDSQVRVDVIGEGSTTVSVRWGRASVVTEGGAPVEAQEGQRIYVDPGMLPSNAVPFDKTTEDSFDAWNRERARLLAIGDSALPASVQYEQTPIGYSDLASYGEWVDVDNRQYWRPTVVADYVPYRDGYWNYGSSYGYSWTDSYPFGYVTSHYGRWNYYPTHGWLWNYDPVWSPAWCATAYYGGNFVWAPLNYYNRPCSYGSNFYVGGIPFSIGFSSYCRPNDLYYGPCSVYPAYNDLFTNVHIGDINIWNIYGGQYQGQYPSFGSTALVRDYNPRRSIRGLESGGNFNVAASVRARALNDGLGRSEFASRASSSTRAIRTSQATGARQARVRDTSLNADTALDTGSTLRRAQRNLESLRGSDDAKPQAAEARRSRVASLERSAENAPNTKLPGANTRSSTARSVRNNEETLASARAQGSRSATDRANGQVATDGNAGRDRMTPREERDADRDRNARSTTPGDAGAGANSGRSEQGERTARSTAPNDPTADRGGERDRSARTIAPDQQAVPNASVNTEARTSRRAEREADENRSNAGARTQAPEASVPTLNNTRARSEAQGSNNQRRTEVPEQARVREPNLPRVSGGDGRNERSQSLGTIPQAPQRSRSALNTPVQTHVPEPSSRAPQSRVIPDSSRVRDAAPRSTEPLRIEQPRAQNQAPRAQMPQQQQMQAPQPRYEAPQQRQMQAPQPRYEAPQQRQMQAPQQRQMQAPQPRYEAPQQRQMQAPSQQSAPQSRAMESSRGSGGGGGNRGGGESRGRSR